MGLAPDVYVEVTKALNAMDEAEAKRWKSLGS